MPKMVDPDERRAAVAEAVWRVIRRDGLERVSVRNVAREAGLSTGSLRHYFASQPQLLEFSMRLVAERVSGRLETMASQGPLREAIERVLTELLPFGQERRAESEVWFAFTARASVDPALRSLNDEIYDDLHDLFRTLLAQAARDGVLREGLDLTSVTAREVSGL